MDGIISTWKFNPTIRGVLIPLSDTAVFSTLLPHNRLNVWSSDKETTRGLSPAESQDDRGADSDALIEQLLSRVRSQTHLSLNNAILLHQSKDLDRFTLGTDLQNFFILKVSADSEENEVCYISLFHSHLYPDPDSSDLWLQNSSSSRQTARGQLSTHFLSPGESVRLEPGFWTLTLGKGLEFGLYIPPMSGQSQPLSGARLLQPSSQAVIRSSSEVQNSRRKADAKSRAALSAPATAAKSVQQKTTKLPVTHGARPRLDADKIHVKASDQLTSPHSPGVIGETHHSRVVLGMFRGEKVAIKYCRRSDVPSAALMWRQEVQALKSFKKHHNIVDILDSDASKYSITMELAPGVSIEKYVDDNFWSIMTGEQCGDVWLGAAQGLHWIHEKGYLYNDLKADNVMYDPMSRRTVLIDFGIAAYYTPSTFSGGGTPCYVAPEYLGRQRFPVGDVWALGVLIMFVSKLIQLPREYWKLSEVFDSSSKDAQTMAKWLRHISATVKQARIANADLLRRMMCPKPTVRITSSELVSFLALAQEQAIAN